jgi:hypothetical protein
MATDYRPISRFAAEVGYGYGWDLASALKANRIAIRDLATYLQVTQRRVRHVRAVGVGRFPYLVGLDYFVAVRFIVRFRKAAAELRKVA